MARTCRLVRAGRSVDAQWRRDGDVLVLSPAGAPALVIRLPEVSGIAGDGFTVRLRLPDGEVALERLGGDGPTLLAELRRDWPVLRAGILRLAGAGSPGAVFSGMLSVPGGRGPFRGFLADGRLIVAPDAGDIFAIFLADSASVTFDEAASAVRLTGWDGGQTVFTKLGGATAAFANALSSAREALALQAAEVLSRFLPTLDAAPRADLSAQWLPGRLLNFAALEALAPGFEAAFSASWLAATPRAASGKSLMDGLAPGARSLGYMAPEEDDHPSLWLLARRGETASFELLSHGDYATYLFQNGDDIPRLVEGLVRLPEFSREALYLPLAQLVGERGIYAIPARDYPPLRELRTYFMGRKVHPHGTVG